MMNIIALAFLVSYFGAVVVLVPEPYLTCADHHAYESYTPSGLFRSAKQSAQNAVCNQEPCPSSMDQVKETVDQGLDKTVEGMQSAKESVQDTVKEVYQQAKHGLQDKAEQVKQGAQDKADSTYETAEQGMQGVQDKAGQVKHGAYETAQQAKQGVQEKAEQVKHGVQETVGKVASHIPSTEDAASFIPGIETGKDVADALKQKLGETKERVASFVKGSDTVSYGRDSVESLRRKLEDVKQQISSYMQGRENDAAVYLIFSHMKKTLDEASSYIPSKEMAASFFPGKDSTEGIKKGVEETTQGMQDKAQDASESARNAARGLQDEARDVGERAHEATPLHMKPGEGAGYKEKLGGVLHGMKDRLTGEERKRDGSGQLERRLHELCIWFDEGIKTNKPAGRIVTLDVAATRESYAYLMENALASIVNAHEVFQRVAQENAGGEWREKYAYLADSAKGALEAAKEVFERAASAAEGIVTAHMPFEKVSSFGEAGNMSRLKEAAIHMKQRLSATLRPLTRTIYLATFSAIYGIALWMTFLSGHLLSRSLPRQQLGMVQSKLFPVYLRLLSGCVGLCAIVHAVLHPWPSADRSEHWQYLNFVLCVVLSLVNLLVVEPRETKVMFERLKFEKEEGRGQSGEEVDDEAVKAIDVKFKRLHQIASSLNLGVVAGLTWHLWYLANRLIV